MLWKCKRQLSDPPAALKKPEVVSGATAIFRGAGKVRKYFGVGWGFLCLGLVGHHFWTLGQFSLGGKSAFHCV